jgi:hypothetical protein
MSSTKTFPSTGTALRSGLRKKAQIVLGCASHPVETFRWLRFLKTHPLLRDVVPSPASFLGKIHLPYLSTALTCTGRVALLMKHYDSLLNAGFGSLVRQAVQKPLTLCVFNGKSGTSYELQLSALETGRQDGELLLRLVSDDACVYSVACVLTASQGKPALMVGGLAGMLSQGRSRGIKQVTRDLHGCRPKDLMVALARDLGRCFGCATTLLIGNGNRIPPAEKYVCKKSSDYDLTWRELHAAPRADGDYELPCAAVEEALERARSTSSVHAIVPPPRRGVLLENIRTAVCANVLARRSTTRYVFTSPITPVVQEDVLERSHT